MAQCYIVSIFALGRDTWKNRSRIEIMGDLLSKCMGGLKRTHIMYKVNLSYKQLCEYLEVLEQAALIELDYDDEGQKIFRTTQKGFEFVDYYQRLNKLASIAAEYESDVRAGIGTYSYTNNLR